MISPTVFYRRLEGNSLEVENAEDKRMKNQNGVSMNVKAQRRLKDGEQLR